MKMVIRKKDLDKLLVLKDQNLIKVVTGVRPAGKSTLLLQFQDMLKEKDPGIAIDWLLDV